MSASVRSVFIVPEAESSTAPESGLSIASPTRARSLARAVMSNTARSPFNSARPVAARVCEVRSRFSTRKLSGPERTARPDSAT